MKQAEPAWYWACDDAHYGDLYQVCAFAAPFRKQHGRRYPIHLIATTKAQAEVAGLFAPCFETITVAPALQGRLGEWTAFYAETGLPEFGLDTPMVIFPVLNPHNAGLWDFAVEDYELSVIPLIKHMLRLPTEAEPGVPPADADRRRRAEALCEQSGMVRRRAVILCPYARSDPVDATLDFAALAAELQRFEYQVFTSIAGAETPIAGTAPIGIPFSLLPDVAEYAGWIVTVRSGVADIVSSAACRKSIIYQTFHSLRNWSLAKLGLCRDAAELVFRFGVESPDDFTKAVIAGLHHPAGGRTHDFSAGTAPNRTASFSTLQDKLPGAFLTKQRRDRLLSPWSKRFRQAGDALRITDVPPHCAIRARDDAGAALSRFAQTAEQGQWHLFACKDGTEQDFFEPVEPLALSRGLYYRAAGWHTILMVGKARRAGDAGLDPVLPDEGIALGVAVSPADALHARAHKDVLTGRLPLCHGGLQFLEGWSELEDWGLWSLSCHSVLKIIFASPPQADLIIELSATVAAFSGAMPVVEFDVRANGLDAGHYALPGSATPHRVEIIIPYPAVRNLRSVLLDFIFPEVMSPCQQGFGPADQRPIGLGIRSVRADVR